MKKRFFTLLAVSVAAMLLFCACGQTGTGGGADSGSEPQAVGQTESDRILIAYFSVMETDGVDTVAGASRLARDGEVMSNNQYVAQQIQEQTGGDLFAIETEQEYPKTHDALLEFAYKEQSENARPQLASRIENPDQYDVIFLGFPNWNADLPMPVYTFLEEYDFSGKTIIPFTTHGGSGFSSNIETIAQLQPDAEVITEGLSISRESVADSGEEIRDWVDAFQLTSGS